MSKLHHCILTGQQLNPPVEIEPTLGPFLTYSTDVVGKVKIALPTLIEWMNNREFHHPILAGICRNAFEKDIEPPMISAEFMTNDLPNLLYPKTTKEKHHFFLKLIYDLGGKDYNVFTFDSERDYTLCFCETPEEFRRIVEHLERNVFIAWSDKLVKARNATDYLDMRLTELGMSEVEKDLPKIPMIGLVSQQVAIGEEDIDNKINHAKDLFFQEPQTMDRMRSACEALSYVLEPMREKIKEHLLAKDVEQFFQMVNNFDIRHNKEHTKIIEYPEQLEWVFYSLLNTINTYAKLRQRFL